MLHNLGVIDSEHLIATINGKLREEAVKDSVWQELKIQIDERIKIQKELEKKFFSTEEKQYFKICSM